MAERAQVRHVSRMAACFKLVRPVEDASPASELAYTIAECDAA